MSLEAILRLGLAWLNKSIFFIFSLYSSSTYYVYGVTLFKLLIYVAHIFLKHLSLPAEAQTCWFRFGYLTNEEEKKYFN